MSSLRTLYEQQLIKLKQEAKDPITAVRDLSNRELLQAINSYLQYFNCGTLTAEELLNVELELNYETAFVEVRK